MEEIDGIAVDLALLRDELQSLVPLIRTFALGDDVVRSTEIETAPVAELEALAGLTREQWAALNHYLDQHMNAQPGSPEQDLALVLSAFGETAAEALLDLRRRRGS